MANVPNDCGTIDAANGHVVHICCGKLDAEPHKNFCEHWTPTCGHPAYQTGGDLAGKLSLTDGSRCPSWCVIHSPCDGGVVHYSDIADVVPTAGGPTERRPYEVTVEQLQPTAAGPMDAAAIMLSGSENPMTPDEALHLAGLLIVAARRATEIQR